MSSAFRVLFILGCNEGPSARYRVFNHIEALRSRGAHAEWMWDIHPEIFDESYMRKFSIVVNFRGGYSDRLRLMMELLRRCGIPTVYDVDDLVFDPSLAMDIDVYRKMDEVRQREYHAGMVSIERAMRASDFVTTSTPFLAEYASTFTGKRTWVIPFGVNDRQIEIARAIGRYQGGPKFISYLSGTKTHERDFEEAAPALRRILEEHADVYLKLVGDLDVDKHLPGLQHKIIRIPFMDW